MSVTASTGMATTALNNLQATTVHRWAGLMDGRYTYHDLDSYMFTDKFSEAYIRILKIEVLVIDKMRMISSYIFSQLEYITRKIRNSDMYFGGLQVILSGSFKQLPTIPNPLYGDHGEFIFTSEIL